MRLSLRQLQIFVAVAEHGGTATAAQAIALSQSATSAALKAGCCCRRRVKCWTLPPPSSANSSRPKD